MLLEAINSVLKQDYQNWELIIIDNYSTDETDEVLAAITDRVLEIRWLPDKGCYAGMSDLFSVMTTGPYMKSDAVRPIVAGNESLPNSVFHEKSLCEIFVIQR
jgi:glycosyltransferase involved in cell wall biosynthesis